MNVTAAALRALALLPIVVDAFVWGIAAHLLLRWLGVREARWLAGGVAAGVAFGAWDHLVFAWMVGRAGLGGLGGTSWSPGLLLEMGLAVAATVLGCRAARGILAGLARRAGASR